MKKLTLIVCVLFAMSAGTKVMAQATDEDYVVFNAHLLDVFEIVVYSGATQTITFATAADYTNGVTEAGGIVPGFSDVSVESTGNWDMTIECPDFVPGGGPNPGTGTIPVNNLGVWIESNGSFVFGNEVNCAYTAAASALGLTIAPTDLITNNTGNAGDIDENDYRMHWLMGTMQGSMNGTSMFDQMQAPGGFTPGDYTTTATLTITEIP
jgi:hypothetical protein